MLNRPNDQYLVNLNAEWFSPGANRWIYEGIKELEPTKVDPISVYGRVKSSHPDAITSIGDIERIKSNFVTDAYIKTLVTDVRRGYLSRKLDRQMLAYQDAATEENRQAMTETIDLLNGLQTVDDNGQLQGEFDALDASMQTPQPTGIKSFTTLDDKLGGGLYGGMLFTIGARPAVGKTAFSINLAYQIAKQDPSVQVDYFTLEMSKREMANRLLSRETGVSSFKIRNAYYLSDDHKLLVRDGIKTFEKLKICVYDRAPNLGEILTIIRRNAAKSEPHKYVAIVDYIGLVSVPGKLDRYLQVGEITRQLKVTANEYDVPIIALSQLNRGIEQRQSPRPMLSDLRESGSVEQDSNVVAFLYKPDADNAPEVETLAIEKNREGATGDIMFGFDPTAMMFKEVPSEALE